jgi:hypothetical protein
MTKSYLILSEQLGIMQELIEAVTALCLKMPRNVDLIEWHGYSSRLFEYVVDFNFASEHGFAAIKTGTPFFYDVCMFKEDRFSFSDCWTTFGVELSESSHSRTWSSQFGNVRQLRAQGHRALHQSQRLLTRSTVSAQHRQMPQIACAMCYPFPPNILGATGRLSHQ